MASLMTQSEEEGSEEEEEVRLLLFPLYWKYQPMSFGRKILKFIEKKITIQKPKKEKIERKNGSGNE